MSSGTPTYLPAPNWDIPANSNIVVLGRLIENPQNPQSMIYNSSVVPIPPHAIYEGEKSDWQTNLEQIRSGGIGFWAKCREIISAGLSSSHIQSSLENHRFTVLETKYFVPDHQYFAQVLNDQGVQNYFQAHDWTKPVYLITGIKIARGAGVSTENSTGWSGRTELKFDATSAGVPVNMGPDASWDLRNKRGISYGASTDYIFAYQVTEVMPNRGGSGSTNKGYVKGAMYAKWEEGHDGDFYYS